MKIVINRCYGGFSISRKAAEFMAARGNERARLELMQSKSAFTDTGTLTVWTEPMKEPILTLLLLLRRWARKLAESVLVFQ